MRNVTKTLIAGAAVAAALAPAASADSLLVDAPGARNLAGAGGYLAWSTPTPDGQWKLTIRGPDGTVSQPAVASFAAPAQPGIGTNVPYGSARKLVAVYARGGDVYELDLKAGTESKVASLSTSADETLAAVNLGQYVVVRKGGARKGVYVSSRSGKERKLTATVPSEIAMAQSRVASIEGTGSQRKVVIRRLSGRGRPLIAGKGLTRANSLWLTRYRAGYATPDAQGITHLYGTKRFAGSGGPFTLQVLRDGWTSTSPLSGIVVNQHGEPGYYLDDQGVKQFATPPFHGA